MPKKKVYVHVTHMTVTKKGKQREHLFLTMNEYHNIRRKSHKRFKRMKV